MKVVITSLVIHDGKELEVGKSVDLPQDVAEALVESRAAEPMAMPAAAKQEA